MLSNKIGTVYGPILEIKHKMHRTCVLVPALVNRYVIGEVWINVWRSQNKAGMHAGVDLCEVFKEQAVTQKFAYSTAFRNKSDPFAKYPIEPTETIVVKDDKRPPQQSGSRAASSAPGAARAEGAAHPSYVAAVKAKMAHPPWARAPEPPPFNAFG